MPSSQGRSSYPLSTNFSHQLKINTAWDADTHITDYIVSSSSQQISRQASTSGNNRMYSVCGHRLYSCLWYSVSWHTDIQDCQIVPDARHHSMVVLLSEREISWNYFQRYQVEHENRPHRRPSRIRVVTFTVQLLHSWYAKANSPGQEGLLRWRHHNLDFWTKDPTFGVHDQQLPETSSWKNTRFWSLRWSQQSGSSPRTHTSFRRIQILLLKIHNYHR